MFSGIDFIGASDATGGAAVTARRKQVASLCATAEELAALCLRKAEVSCTVMGTC